MSLSFGLSQSRATYVRKIVGNPYDFTLGGGIRISVEIKRGSWAQLGIVFARFIVLLLPHVNPQTDQL